MATGFGTMNDEPQIIIGERHGWGEPQRFGISREDQRQHIYIIGKTGSGKTTLLRNMIVQHIALGHGVGLIDPHGDLAEEILDHIPPHRADHLVYFNPGDIEYPIAFNLLAHVAPDDRHLVASGIVSAFKSIWRDSWGPRLEYIVYDELKAFFANPQKIAEHLSATKNRLSERETALLAHQREIQKVRDEMTRTHKLYLDGEITAQGFGTFYRPAEERLNQLTSALPKLQAEVDVLRVNNVSGDEVLVEAQGVYGRWPKMTIEQKRPIVQSLIEKVIVGKGEVELSFSYLPTSEEQCKSQQQLRGSG